MFLDGVPLTGIAFCYAPLLVTVLGFVLFAAMTDLDARRTYLRRALGGPQPRKPYAAMTPARDEILFTDGDVTVAPKISAAPVVSPQVASTAGKPQVAAPKGAVAEVKTSSKQASIPEADKLTLIEGVGPKTADALAASGITTFAQIASMDAAELERIVKEEHGVRIVGDAETWPKQAQYLVDGDVDGLQAYQSRLVGGREPEE